MRVVRVVCFSGRCRMFLLFDLSCGVCFVRAFPCFLVYFSGPYESCSGGLFFGSVSFCVCSRPLGLGESPHRCSFCGLCIDETHGGRGGLYRDSTDTVTDAEENNFTRLTHCPETHEHTHCPETHERTPITDAYCRSHPPYGACTPGTRLHQVPTPAHMTHGASAQAARCNTCTSAQSAAIY